MTDRIWILGASDPEMEAIESLLRECGEHVAYAVDERGERVRGGEAYRAHVALSEVPSAIYLVECHVDVDAAIDDIGGTDRVIDVRRIDHHRPGDPGHGRPPEKFLPASSIGQVIATLARLMLPLGWETIAGPSWPWESGTYEMTTVRDRRVWRSDPGVYDTSGEWDWAVSCGAGCWYLVPRDLVIAAAADHCLAHAYAGECPGVDPDALMRWRVETRAAHQGRSVEELLADVERAREALREAPFVSLGFDIDAPGCAHHRGCAVPDCGACDYEGGALIVRDLRGCAVCGGCGGATGAGEDHGYDPSAPCHYGPAGVPELPEAAAREGVAYLATVTDRDGRRKVVLGGHTTPETVRAFMHEWAPAQGVVDIYGDPDRGFAGGYLPQHDETLRKLNEITSDADVNASQEKLSAAESVARSTAPCDCPSRYCARHPRGENRITTSTRCPSEEKKETDIMTHKTSEKCDALRGLESWSPSCQLEAGHDGPHRWT